MIASSAANGSSSASTGLPASSVRRNDTRWRMPPDSCGRSCAARSPASPKRSSHGAAAARACARETPRARSASPALSSALSHGSSRSRWGISAAGAALTRTGSRAAGGRRSARAASSCRTRSDRRRRRPRRGAARSDIPSRACISPNWRLTTSTRHAAGSVKIARLLDGSLDHRRLAPSAGITPQVRRVSAGSRRAWALSQPAFPPAPLGCQMLRTMLPVSSACDRVPPRGEHEDRCCLHRRDAARRSACRRAAGGRESSVPSADRPARWV